MWKKFQLFNTLEGSSAIYYNDKIYLIYGKITIQFTSDDNPETDQIDFDECSKYILEFEPKIETYKLIHHENGPSRRKFHTCNLYQDQIVFFGGDNFDEKTSNETWLLNLKNFKWKQVGMNKEVPRGRRYHSSTIFQDDFYIFGGQQNYYEGEGIFLEDFWKFNLKTYKWEELKCKLPTSRRYFTFHTFGNCLYLFGGRDDNKRMNDLWKYEINNNKWNELKPTGNIPVARSGQTSILYENSIFIFGGNDDSQKFDNNLNEYNISLNTWNIIKTTNNPQGRFWHTSVFVDDEKSMYIFGGFNSQKHFRDGYKIQLEKPVTKKCLWYSIFHQYKSHYNDVDFIFE